MRSRHTQHSYHQVQDAPHPYCLTLPALPEPWWLWETTAEIHLGDGLTIFADRTTHQQHILNVPRGAPTMDIRRGIRVPAVAAAKVVVDTLLTETTLRGVRGAGHQDGHTTTIQMNPSEEDPQDHLAEALLDLQADGPAVTLDCGRFPFETAWCQKEKKPTRSVSYRCPPLQVSDRGRLHSATKWLELRATPTKDSSGSRRSNSQVQTWHICTTAHLSTPWTRSLPRRSPRL